MRQAGGNIQKTCEVDNMLLNTVGKFLIFSRPVLGKYPTFSRFGELKFARLSQTPAALGFTFIYMIYVCFVAIGFIATEMEFE